MEKKKESKMEKFEEWDLKPDDRFCGNDISTLKGKVNEIIDYLNSQDQGERVTICKHCGAMTVRGVIDLDSEETSKRCMKCKKVIPTGEANSSIDGSFICCDECLWKDTTEDGEEKKGVEEKIKMILDDNSWTEDVRDGDDWSEIAYYDEEDIVKELVDFIEQELDKAREEGYEQCKKDFISNFCDVADRPLIISKTVVKDMFAQLKDGVNLWEDKLKDNK
jgi:hypothetical protein